MAQRKKGRPFQRVHKLALAHEKQGIDLYIGELSAWEKQNKNEMANAFMSHLIKWEKKGKKEYLKPKFEKKRSNTARSR